MLDSSSVETIARRSAYRKPGARRIAVERDHVQLTCARRGEQAQLGRPGA